jgi:hypothetical protein
MAVIAVQGTDGTRLSDAQTGNGDSTNIAFRGNRLTNQAGGIVITSAVGATPTVTINIQGSFDGVNYVNIPYSAENLLATAPTWVITALTITTAKTGFYVLQPGVGWRYLKLVYSANTNVTLTVDAYL